MRRALGLLAAAAACAAQAQEIEPRAYSNAPVGVNFVILGATYSTGALIFDPSVPITDAHLKTPAALFAYARVFGLGGKSAKVDVVVPYSWLSGNALYQGQPVERDVDGFADPKVRLSVNFVGAPALGLKEFAAYRQKLIVGASLQVSIPVGQYDSTKLVNLGTNRWAYKLEGAVSKARGPWTLECSAAVSLFGDNDDFFGGLTREQDPLYSFQAHGVYNFRSGVWLALDATYYTGGRTTVDGELNDDLQQNWRGGATLAIPVDRRNSVKLYASSGVSARTGSDYDLYGVGWQHRWGGGL